MFYFAATLYHLKTIPSNIIISRTDSIGDMVLALPAAKILKNNFPGIQVAFMGKQYVRAVVEACEYADAFIDVEDFLAKEISINNKKPDAIIHFLTNKPNAVRAANLAIPLRIGTSTRFYHWYTCNKFAWVSRKNSPLHEAQLNLQLLSPLGIKNVFSYQDISESYGLTKFEKLLPQYSSLISNNKYNIIIHPRSQGNAREWPMQHFIKLIELLDINYYNIFISGTAGEKKSIEPLLNAAGERVTDLTGKINLAQFISFIAHCNGVVTNSTGPLHLAAALGKNALGIYPPLHPKHAGRWGPIGANATVFALEKKCSDCRNDKCNCACMSGIEPISIKIALDNLMSKKLSAR